MLFHSTPQTNQEDRLIMPLELKYAEGVGIEPPPRFLDGANGFAARGVPSTTALFYS